MNEILYIFLEGREKGWFENTVNVVRKNGRVFDFVLQGEKVRSWEAVSEEKVEDVMMELKSQPQIRPKLFSKFAKFNQTEKQKSPILRDFRLVNSC